MSQQKKTQSHHRAGREKLPAGKTAVQGVPLIVVYWAIGLGVFGYVGSRFAFTPHPLHWASLAGGVLLGVIVGYIWYWKRGDVGLI